MDSKVLFISTLFVCFACLSIEIQAQIIPDNGPIQYVFRPYEFAYQSNDGLGTTQHRKEAGNENGSVKGSYGFMDPFGMYRAVDYVADTNGFRAVVKTNEPGTANQNPADTVWLVQPPPDVVSPTSTNQRLLKKISLPAQVSSANFTPIASSSGVTNVLYPSLSHSDSSAIQHPYPVLVGPGAAHTAPVSPYYYGSNQYAPKLPLRGLPRTGNAYFKK